MSGRSLPSGQGCPCPVEGARDALVSAWLPVRCAREAARPESAAGRRGPEHHRTQGSCCPRAPCSTSGLGGCSATATCTCVGSPWPQAHGEDRCSATLAGSSWHKPSTVRPRKESHARPFFFFAPPPPRSQGELLAGFKAQEKLGWLTDHSEEALQELAGMKWGWGAGAGPESHGALL